MEEQIFVSFFLVYCLSPHINSATRESSCSLNFTTNEAAVIQHSIIIISTSDCVLLLNHYFCVCWGFDVWNCNSFCGTRTLYNYVLKYIYIYFTFNLIWNDMLPQPSDVLLLFKYSNIIISQTSQEGSTADWRWAAANQSHRAVVRLWHLIGWWEIRIPDLSNTHLTKHLRRKHKYNTAGNKITFKMCCWM